MPARFCALFALCLCLWPVAKQADAGAWPREKGHGFASVSIRLGWPQDLDHWVSTQPHDQYRTAYLEYGLTDRLMFGLDLGNSISGDTKAIAFLQYPLRYRDRGPIIAAQIGLGTIAGHNVIRPGLSLGLGYRKGWLGLESFAEMRADMEQADYKLDITLGRNLPNNRKVIFQIQTGQQHGDAPFTRLAPSVVFPISGNLLLETGATWGVTGDTFMGLKLELWGSF